MTGETDQSSDGDANPAVDGDADEPEVEQPADGGKPAKSRKSAK